ncbi:MAG: hypothetical protein Q4A17_09155 [Thermoguttaceae bacterium]|nr:hypothetical protein [Thermoguttaceae bacterium]
MSNIPTIRIAMFGSRSTGKTTFLSSFVCPVSLQGCSLAITDPETKSYLNQNWSLMMNGEKPGATAMMIKDKLWFTLRYPNKREEQDEDAWKIQIKDYPGRLVEWDDPNEGGAWDETKKDELSLEFKKKLAEHIQESDAILFLAPVDIAEWKPKDQKLYMAYINDIIEIAKQCRGDYSASIPFCMALMKWDMTDIAIEPLTMNPDANFPLDPKVDSFMKEHPIFQKIYGIIDASSNEDVSVFATSAFGAHAADDHTRPDPENLEPFNVLPVLYWLCRKAEAIKVRVAERKIARITADKPELTDENYQEIQDIYDDLLADGINDIDKRKEILSLAEANRNAHIDFTGKEIEKQFAIIDQKRFMNKPAEKLQLLQKQQARKLFHPEDEIDLKHDIEAMSKAAKKRRNQIWREWFYGAAFIGLIALLFIWGFLAFTAAGAFTQGEDLIAKAPENLTNKDFEAAGPFFKIPQVFLENYIPWVKGRREAFYAKMESFNKSLKNRMEEKIQEFPIDESLGHVQRAEMFRKRRDTVKEYQGKMTKNYALQFGSLVDEYQAKADEQILEEVKEQTASQMPAEDAEALVKSEAFQKLADWVKDTKAKIENMELTKPLDRQIEEFEKKQLHWNNVHLLQTKISEIENAEPPKVLALIEDFGKDSEGNLLHREEFSDEFVKVEKLRNEKVEEFRTGLENELEPLSGQNMEETNFMELKQLAKNREEIVSKYLAYYPEGNEKYAPNRQKCQEELDRITGEIADFEKHIPIKDAFDKAMGLPENSDEQLVALMNFLNENPQEEYPRAQSLFTQAKTSRDSILDKIEQDWKSDLRDCTDQPSDDLNTLKKNVQERKDIHENYLKHFSEEICQYEKAAKIKRVIENAQNDENIQEEKIQKWENYQKDFDELKANYEKWDRDRLTASNEQNLIDEINTFISKYNEPVYKEYFNHQAIQMALNNQRAQLDKERNIKDAVEKAKQIVQKVDKNPTQYLQNKKDIDGGFNELNTLGNDPRIDRAKENLKDCRDKNNNKWEKSEWEKVQDAMDGFDNDWSEDGLKTVLDKIDEYESNNDSPKKNLGNALQLKLYYRKLSQPIKIKFSGKVYYNGNIDAVDGSWLIFAHTDGQEEQKLKSVEIQCRANGSNNFGDFEFWVLPTDSLTLRLQLYGHGNLFLWLNRPHANDGQARISIRSWHQNSKFVVPINRGHAEFFLEIDDFPEKPACRPL